MSKHRVTFGTDEIVVEIGQPEDQILVDGESFGVQCAAGRCETLACCLFAARYAFDGYAIDAVDIQIEDEPDPKTIVETGWYGTDEETFWVSPVTRAIWCVQSPDFAQIELNSVNVFARRCESLPESAEMLSDDAVADIDIPDEIVLADAELAKEVEQAKRREEDRNL